MNSSRLSITGFAVSLGVLTGLYLFLLALFTMFGFSFWWFQPAYLEFLTPAFAGLAATWAGAFIGLLHGLICGAFCGGVFAWAYNVATACKAKCC